MTERLSVNVSDVTAKSITEIMDMHGDSATETVRRAIALLVRVERAEEDGYVLELVNPKTGDVRTLTLIR
jgi:hypothetical protein